MFIIKDNLQKPLLKSTSVLLLLVLLISCLPQDPEPGLRNGIAITEQLMASFELLDMDNRPRNRFREGENFQFSFRLRNVSERDTLQTRVSTTPLARNFVISNPEFFSVMKVAVKGYTNERMGRAVNSGPAEPFTLIGFALLPKTTLTYQVVWQTLVGIRYPMPLYDPVPRPGSWYDPRNYTRTGKEPKVERLLKGDYYSAFTLTIFGKQVPFRVDFTVY